MPASEIIEQLAALLTEFRPRFAGAAGYELDELLERLRNPVRVAVVGRVKAGKSTLVNALLGQVVAPTDVSECTKIVTWFHYGHPERVEVRLLDGSTVLEQLDERGRLPAELGVPAGQVAALHVYLANDELRDVTLIDTPGIASVNEEYSAATERLLTNTAHREGTTDQADAVVFLMNQVLMAEEMEALELLRASASAQNSALNTMGVLSKADKLGDGEEDPWPVAVALADRYSGDFRQKVSTVVPVIGLVAESAETASFLESDATAVAALARIEPARFDRMLWSPDRFLQAECDVSQTDRERLLALLDIYGIRQAVAAAGSGVTGATALRRALSGLSGIAQVKALLMEYFGRKDHLLKARSAFAVAERVSYWTGDALEPDAPGRLRARLEQLRLDPMMHPLKELDAWQECRAGQVNLEPDIQEEVDRLFEQGTLAARVGVGEGDLEAVVQAAAAGIRRWRAFMTTRANPAQAGVARVVIRSYELVWTEAKQQPSMTT
jgi:GTP-binding protein EngB required for normal cell division